MSNTLTGLLPTLYEALDIVSRELTGFIPAVQRNSSIERAGKDQTVRIPITPTSDAANIEPAQYAPDTGDQTISYTDITIDNARAVPVRWNGEEQRSYGTNGTLNQTLRDQFAQAMRTLVNEVEADIASEYYKASRAYGTAATTPFGASLEDAAQIKKILDDNGAPMSDRHLIINTTAGVNLRTLANLNQANTAGSDSLLRQGVLLPIFGMDIRESAQIQSHTAGSATGFDLIGNEAAESVTLEVDGNDSGTILQGDVVTWTSYDSYGGYVVQSATASQASSGNIVIASPGLMEAVPSTTEGTLASSYTANMAFHRDAIQLVTRMPARPSVGDMADDVTQIVDPRTGLAFEIAVYKQYRQVHYEIGIAWGTALIKPAHACLLIG
jgi:hypothetical protein